ncbi:MAG: MATE family efflux transporter [Desulfovibrionaceae bacterium]|nr:MATE family efflux transporter [Desulfovibrionaceae bacterium]MDD4951012.1 MATE family efflux transporter [Desulfovibrionaceae bacterium]
MRQNAGGRGSPGGYGQVLAVGLPLVVSLGSITVMQFTDRIFLSRYSLEAIAASLPAGLASFLFTAFFLGLAEYVAVFVAQYVGSGARERVGAALWQGLWFCLFAGLALACLALLAGPLFSLSGHPPEVRRLEAEYYFILTMGSGLGVTSACLSCFFSGRGLTMPVMIVNLIGAGLNIPLDYALINGAWFFPELGIAGAGLATVASWAVSLGLFAALIFTKENNARFAVWRNRALDRELLLRLLRFGAPGGAQLFIDMLAVTLFVFVVGGLGREALAASNIVIAINHLSFLPMVGLSMAASVLVGQAMGRGLPDLAARSTWNTLRVALIYMAAMAFVFLAFPDWLMGLFRTRDLGPEEYAPIAATGRVLLRFVALYSLLDAFALVCSGALKGAGDTRFTMLAVLWASVGCMALPLFLTLKVLGLGLYAAWCCLSAYVFVLGAVLWRRFRQGRWRSVRVIETLAAGPDIS